MYASTHARSQSTQYDRQTKIRSKQKNLCLFIPYLIPYYTRQFFDDKKTTLSHTFTDISEHHKRFHDSNRHHHPHCCCCSFVCWFVLWITILFREKHSISKLEWGCACWETKMNTCLRMVAVWFKKMLVKWQIFSPEFLSSLFKGMHKCKKQQQKDGSVVHEVVFSTGKKCDSFEMNSFRCWLSMLSFYPCRKIANTDRSDTVWYTLCSL